MSAADLVIVDLADENAALREQLVIATSYREALQLAIGQLVERTRDLEAARHRNASLVAELRTIRDTVAA